MGCYAVTTLVFPAYQVLDPVVVCVDTPERYSLLLVLKFLTERKVVIRVLGLRGFTSVRATCTAAITQ